MTSGVEASATFELDIQQARASRRRGSSMFKMEDEVTVEVTVRGAVVA